MSDAQLARIARDVDGDAKVTIDSLRRTASSADEADHDEIRGADVTAALAGTGAIEDNGDEIPDYLLPDHEELLDIVETAGEIAPGKVYKRYTDRVESPKTERTPDVLRRVGGPGTPQ